MSIIFFFKSKEDLKEREGGVLMSPPGANTVDLQ